jgi:transcription elongation factor GreA
MPTKSPITQEGYDKLITELEERKTITREQIANDIETARSQGDLSENAAYSAAMTAKEFNENRIEELVELIKNSEIIEGSTNNNKVELGEEITLTDVNTKRKVTYRLVGANEANPQEGKISADSPIGSAILGKNYGDTVEIELPSGKVKFVIAKA